MGDVDDHDLFKHPPFPYDLLPLWPVEPDVQIGAFE